MTYKDCKDAECRNIVAVGKKFNLLYRLVSSPSAENGNDNFLSMPIDGGDSGGDSQPTDTIEDEISGLLLELMIKNREGTVDLERIRMVRLQASKISTNLKRLEKLIQEESSENAREEIKRVIQRGIKNLLPNPEC
jgi:hypothetical protein